MSNLILTQNKALTMGSREIAKLLNKNHSDIKRSAERLLKLNVINNGQPLAEGKFTTTNGNTFTEYMITKRDSLILVAQNCPAFTATIVDRWQELESKQAFQIPQTLGEALQLAADQAKQLELAAPKVAFVDNYVNADGNKSFREVAKLLKANEREFRDFLVDFKVMYRLGKSWTAYANHIDAGRFFVTTGENNGHVFTDCKFTPKGIEFIAGKWLINKSEGDL